MVGGRRPLVGDDLLWKTTSVGRRPLVEDNLCWKTTFGERRPSEEDDILWKTTFVLRQPSVEDNLQRTLHAAYSNLRHFLSPVGANFDLRTELSYLMSALNCLCMKLCPTWGKGHCIDALMIGKMCTR